VIRFLFLLLALSTLHPAISGGAGLLLGLIFALTLGNPFSAETKNLSRPLLSLAVMGLGAGVNLIQVMHAGADGVGYTVCGIAFAFAVGLALGRWLRIDRNVSLLVTTGTAICGGSAIAALSPVIRARNFETSVAMGIVFLLNALALFLFPWIGHAFGMNDQQFGLWSALAIHDTSSVVGASVAYGGADTVLIATTVKLARALWIVPLTLVIGYLVNRGRDEDGLKVKSPFPWFILGFVALSALATYLPQFKGAFDWIEFGARRILVLTLFVIGANLSRENLKQVGFRPLAMGVVLWLVVASVSLVGILTLLRGA
jgi:uncharacterized integral membrane protein (TIGR00698 family)